MDLFYRNPRLTVLAVGLILVAGLSSLNALARQEDPTLTRRFGTVTTRFPGASALRVESLVTEKLEESIQELHEVAELDSFSRAGLSVVSVELDDVYGEAQVDEIWSKLRDKLGDAQAQLPEGAGTPEFEDRTTTAVTVLSALVWRGAGEPPLALMGRIAEELESRLRNLPNTKETDLFGEPEEEIRVTVDPGRLAALGLTALDVSRAIARADSKVPAGQLRHGGGDLLIEVEGELTSIERVRDVPVRERPDGQLLRVGDLARVQKTVVEPPRTVAWIDGLPGIAVAATMESDHRVDRWAASAHAVIEAFRAEVPAGIGLEVIFDQSRYTAERLGTLVVNIVLGACMVGAVLLVLMGVRNALIVATALPLTIAMVLAEMQLLGIPLHQMSITGLIIALGLLIDNAIVVVDEYDSAVRAGFAPGHAVAHTVRRLRVPLAASTLTTVLAFLPIALMPGGSGEFVGPIAIGVALSVVSSFLLAMSVVPALAGFFGAKGPRTEPQSWWRDGWSDPRVTALYRRSLRVAIGRPWIGVAVSVVLPIVGFGVGQTLSQQFFPANDRNQFQLQIELPSHTSLEETERRVLAARELLHRHPEVRRSHWFVGESSPRVYYNMFGNEDGVSSFAGAFVVTDSPKATEALLAPLQAELARAFPDALVLALPFEQGPPFEAPIEVRVAGPDVDELRRIGEQVRAVLSETERVTYTRARLSGGEPKLLIKADEDAARLAGLRLVDIAEQLNARLEGAVGGTVLEGTEELPVRVRVAETDRERLGSIAGGRVISPTAGDVPSNRLPGVPVSAVAEVRLVPEISGVTRRNGQRTNTVQAFLEPYALIAASLADFEGRLAASGFELPDGYRLEFGGEDEQRSDAMSDLLAFALPLFVLMGGAIILSFNSFRLAGLIFCVAFLSVGLAQLGVWMFGWPMGFVAIVGTMGLVGLAINDAIVVLTALRASDGASRGELEPTVAVVIGATRHVTATTFTTIGGFMPLIVFGGRFWPPMATAIAGGVAGCSILALYFVPAVYRSMRRREARKAGDAPVLRPPPRPSSLAPQTDAAA